MDLEVAFGILLLSTIYFGMGFFCLNIWSDMFEDIPWRPGRAVLRLSMTILWPAWVALWVVCVAIGIFVMCIVEICK